MNALCASLDTPFSDAVRILEAHYYEHSELAQWLNAAHPQLSGRTPLVALAEGDAGAVLAAVERLDDAVYL